MRWLIVEDALRDRKGHWHEYVAMFVRELRALGDQVDVLADRNADAFIASELGAQPVLPPSIWHRLGDGSGALKRLLRFPAHALATYRVMGRHLRAHPRAYDVIFVPTVSAHHLLGWTPVINRFLTDGKTRVLLFFIQLPAEIDHGSGAPVWQKSPTSRVLTQALRWLTPAVARGTVILGAEPRAMRDALADLSGLPAVLFPQPVHRYFRSERKSDGEPIRLACYGAARAEKGSDLLQQAMLRYLAQNPTAHVKFAIQWVEDFTDENGRLVQLDSRLAHDQRVQVIPRYFQGDEYTDHLARTDIMLLPYRLRAYELRGSRVAVEAMVNGIPVVATRGSTFARQLSEHGASVEFEDGDLEGLVAAIADAVSRHETLKARAIGRLASARAAYSVAAFRASIPAATPQSNQRPVLS